MKHFLLAAALLAATAPALAGPVEDAEAAATTTECTPKSKNLVQGWCLHKVRIGSTTVVVGVKTTISGIEFTARILEGPFVGQKLSSK